MVKTDSPSQPCLGEEDPRALFLTQGSQQQDTSQGYLENALDFSQYPTSSNKMAGNPKDHSRVSLLAHKSDTFYCQSDLVVNVNFSPVFRIPPGSPTPFLLRDVWTFTFYCGPLTIQTESTFFQQYFKSSANCSENRKKKKMRYHRIPQPLSGLKETQEAPKFGNNSSRGISRQVPSTPKPRPEAIPTWRHELRTNGPKKYSFYPYTSL